MSITGKLKHPSHTEYNTKIHKSFCNIQCYNTSHGQNTKNTVYHINTGITTCSCCVCWAPELVKWCIKTWLLVSHCYCVLFTNCNISHNASAHCKPKCQCDIYNGINEMILFSVWVLLSFLHCAHLHRWSIKHLHSVICCSL